MENNNLENVSESKGVEKSNVIISKGLTNTISILIILILILFVSVIVGYIKFNSELKEVKEELIHTKEVLKEYGVYIDPQPQTDTSYDTSVFNVIKPSDIATESKGKSIVVWIGRQSCGYCSMYAPYITEAMNNYGIKAYYIDLAQLIEFNAPQPYIIDEEQYGILSGLSGKGKWEKFAYENVGGTPLTLIVKDNQVIGGLSGYADTNKVMEVFKDAGLKQN